MGTFQPTMANYSLVSFSNKTCTVYNINLNMYLFRKFMSIFLHILFKRGRVLITNPLSNALKYHKNTIFNKIYFYCDRWRAGIFCNWKFSEIILKFPGLICDFNGNNHVMVASDAKSAGIPCLGFINETTDMRLYLYACLMNTSSKKSFIYLIEVFKNIILTSNFLNSWFFYHLIKKFYKKKISKLLLRLHIRRITKKTRAISRHGLTVYLHDFLGQTKYRQSALSKFASEYLTLQDKKLEMSDLDQPRKIRRIAFMWEKQRKANHKRMFYIRRRMYKRYNKVLAPINLQKLRNYWELHFLPQNIFYGQNLNRHWRREKYEQHLITKEDMIYDDKITYSRYFTNHYIDKNFLNLSNFKYRELVSKPNYFFIKLNKRQKSFDAWFIRQMTYNGWYDFILTWRKYFQLRNSKQGYTSRYNRWVNYFRKKILKKRWLEYRMMIKYKYKTRRYTNYIPKRFIRRSWKKFKVKRFRRDRYRFLPVIPFPNKHVYLAKSRLNIFKKNRLIDLFYRSVEIEYALADDFKKSTWKLS